VTLTNTFRKSTKDRNYFSRRSYVTAAGIALIATAGCLDEEPETTSEETDSSADETSADSSDNDIDEQEITTDESSSEDDVSSNTDEQIAYGIGVDSIVGIADGDARFDIFELQISISDQEPESKYIDFDDVLVDVTANDRSETLSYDGGTNPNVSGAYITTHAEGESTDTLRGTDEDMQIEFSLSQISDQARLDAGDTLEVTITLDTETEGTAYRAVRAPPEIEPGESHLF